MKKEFLCLLAPIIMLGTGACASGNTSESVVVVGEDKEVGAGASESAVEGQAEDGAELDTGELQKFTDYFQEPANNFFLTTAYDCPENIDWSGLLEHEVVGHQVSPEEAELVKDMCSAFARTEIIPENLMDVVTAVSGSSPAYVFMFIEAMADAAVAGGMPRDKAYIFASQAVLGSAKMVLETGKHPGELKDMVCSPAGTTIQAVRVLEKQGFRSAVIECMEKCLEISRKL